MKTLVKVDHPVCHMMNGRRLYYLLIAFNTYEHTIKNTINRVLKDSGLLDSSCGYLIYGPADLLVRVWATAEELNKLLDGLRIVSGIDPSIKIHLIDDISTWAQRDLEGMETWDSGVVHSQLDDILNANIPPELTREISCEHVKVAQDNSPESKVRVFLFSEAHYTTHAEFFYQVCDLVALRLSEKRLERSGKAFASSRVSIDASGVAMEF